MILTLHATNVNGHTYTSYMSFLIDDTQNACHSRFSLQVFGVGVRGEEIVKIPMY
jgi:hypothetical protein